MRITIQIDDVSREATVSGDGSSMTATAVEAEDAGMSRAAEVPASGDADAENGGPPPEWLVEEIDRASADAFEGTGDGAGGDLEDAGGGPE